MTDILQPYSLVQEKNFQNEMFCGKKFSLSVNVSYSIALSLSTSSGIRPSPFSDGRILKYTGVENTSVLVRYVTYGDRTYIVKNTAVPVP